MSTRRLYSIKWRGRYYECWAECEPYPDGLGKRLLQPIPGASRDPEAYRKWLEAERAKFSSIEATLEQHVFSVSLETIVNGVDLPSPTEVAVQGLVGLPTYIPPRDGVSFVDDRYIVDLDHERFFANGTRYNQHGKSLFSLQRIPSHWAQALEQTENDDNFSTFALASESAQEHSPSLSYQRLNPSLVIPKHRSHLNRQPHFFIAKRAFKHFVRGYSEIINFTIASAEEPTEYMFRNICFVLICLTSCSNDLVRLLSYEDYECTPSWPFWASSGEKKPELISPMFHCYHLANKPVATAPDGESYWFSGVLVYPVLDLDSRENMQKAVVKVVGLGRFQGRFNFSAIIVSLVHVVLVRALGGAVQHTKQLNLIDNGPGSSKSDAFDALAHLFEAQNCESLRPSTAGNHGRLPNEIYRRIVDFCDKDTRRACLSVSRAFRDYSLDFLHLRTGIELIARPRGLPKFYLADWSGDREFFPVITFPNGTASFTARVLFKLRWYRLESLTLITNFYNDAVGYSPQYETLSEDSYSDTR